MVDLNQSVIEYLIDCPIVRANPLFFNAIKAKDGTKQIVTLGNSIILNKPYIDGSVLRRYTFTLICFESVSYEAIPKVPGISSENVSDMFILQGIIDWVREQNELGNFPDFGKTNIVEEIRTTTDNPNLNGIDSNVTPPLAKYSIAIEIDYLDKSKQIWS